jgi:hypothetical protein
MSAMMGGLGMMGLGCGRSSYYERHDPDRIKTPGDLKRMKEAQDKRDKRASRKS